MKGTSVIVTGSTSGIGFGIAEAFAQAGASVTLNSHRRNEAAEAALAELGGRHGERIAFGLCDVSNPDQWQSMVGEATERFGKVDVLVNNAGIQFTAPAQDFPREKWDQIIAVNLSSVFHGTQAVLPQMLARGTGRIVNIASVHGLVASANKAAYVAAKHGVVGLTKVVALETARTDITCNAICPGWVLTPLVEKQIRDRAEAEGTSFETEKAELVEEKQPSGEFATPAEIGALALFLCSDAASQITGQALAVDGGWLAQ